MAKPVQAVVVGKWAVGFNKSRDMTLLQFEFTDRPAINLALSRQDADQIAKAMLEQLRKSPPSRSEMN